MGIAQEMKDTDVECARTPGRISIWSEQLGRYVCSEDPGFQQAMAEQSTITTVARAPISSAFKLVFLTAAGGTLLFVVICVGTTVYMGRTPSSSREDDNFTFRPCKDWLWGSCWSSSGLIHSDDSQIGRSSSSSHYESRNCRQRHASRSSPA
jgi:hypothetical protein